jgi:uncharacterized protein YjbI with pentapeptide repeats
VNAILNSADLPGAYFRVARFKGTDLPDADLRNVEGLTEEQLDAAVLNEDTKLPLDLPKGMRNGA